MENKGTLTGWALNETGAGCLCGSGAGGGWLSAKAGAKEADGSAAGGEKSLETGLISGAGAKTGAGWWDGA